MEFDVLTLSRLQFALTIMFHYLFPPLSIGLGGIMVLMEGTYLATKNPLYEAMTKFWTKLFAVNFAMGVATGIVSSARGGTAARCACETRPTSSASSSRSWGWPTSWPTDASGQRGGNPARAV